MSGMTVIFNDYIQQLDRCGVENPQKEFLRLLAFVCNREFHHFIGKKSIQLDTDVLNRLLTAVNRRCSREPFHYITGKCEFWKYDFEVNKHVLIPRPETEHLIETVLDMAGKDFSGIIVDCCTGSGCLAVSLGREMPGSTVIASDISVKALDVALKNSHKNRCSNVLCLQTDMLNGFGEGVADIIVSNPPYVEFICRKTMQPEVVFEPDLALYAGEDGMEKIKKLIVDSKRVLKKNGLLIFEYGAGQTEMIKNIIEKECPNRYDEFRIIQDLSGTDRIGVLKYAG